MMENNETNRLKLAKAVWETLTLNDIHEQFIFQSIQRYETDPDAFQDDAASMDLDDKEGE